MCQTSQCLREINNLSLSGREEKKKIDEKKKKTLERDFDAKLGFQGELIKSNCRTGVLPCKVRFRHHTDPLHGLNSPCVPGASALEF